MKATQQKCRGMKKPIPTLQINEPTLNPEKGQSKTIVTADNND